MPSVHWAPLFSGDDARRLGGIIDHIVRDLAELRPVPGDWGPALLHAYLGVTQKSQAHLDCADSHLDSAASVLERTNLGPSLYHGIAGAGWLAAHIDTLVDRRNDSLLEEVDDCLLAFVERPLITGYDLISGAVGVGVYFLERLPLPVAAEGLRRIVASLEALAEVRQDEVTWFTPASMLPNWQRLRAPQGYYNLGVAHGVPGVIGFCANIKRRGVVIEGLDVLMERAMTWVLRHRLPDGTYDTWSAPGSAPVSNSRLAWCYGELGLSLTLLQAARASANKRTEVAALEIASHAATCRDATATKDAGLCHGAAGNAHLFNRLFQATRHEEYRQAARFWFDRALQLRTTQGIGGFRSWKPLDINEQLKSNPWEDDQTFLTGSSGIGLALLAAISDSEPLWDRVLLSDLQPI